MKNFILLLTLILAFNLNANTDPNDFETLKQLEGKWIGTLERTDETSDSLILEFNCIKWQCYFGRKQHRWN